MPESLPIAIRKLQNQAPLIVNIDGCSREVHILPDISEHPVDTP